MPPPSPKQMRTEAPANPVSQSNGNADCDIVTETATLDDDNDDDDSILNYHEEFEELVPFDVTRAGLLHCLERVSMKTLMQEGTKSSSRLFIDFQLMRLISPINSSASNSAHLYSVHNRN